MSFWVTVPSHTTRTTPSGDQVVLYLVQVGVELPNGERVRHSVLRRFSDCRALYDNLQSQFPSKKVPDAPRKRRLHFVNQNAAAIEERRRQLEQWLWKLLAIVEIAHSPALTTFLELSKLHQGRKYPAELDRASDPPRLQETDQASASEAGASVETYSRAGLDDDVSSEGSLGSSSNVSSVHSTPSKLPNQIASGNGWLPQSETDVAAALAAVAALNSSSATPPSSGPSGSTGPRSASPNSAGSHGEEADGALGMGVNGLGLRRSSQDLNTTGSVSGAGSIRIALPMEQKMNMKRMLETLQRRHTTAKSDLVDAIACLQSESAVKDLLAEKVTETETVLEQTRKQGADALEASAVADQERYTALQWELQSVRSELAATNAAQSSSSDEVASIREAAAKEVSAIREETEEVRTALAKAEAAVSASQTDREESENRSKAERKVLSKEVRNLRKSLAEAQAAAEAAKADAEKARAELQQLKASSASPSSPAEVVDAQKNDGLEAMLREEIGSMLKEVSTFRTRLSDSSVDSMMKEVEETGIPSRGTEESMQILATSDNRISCLLAEAQLMGQPDDEQNSEVKSHVSGVRQGYAQLLGENAQLRKSINSLFRNALIQAASLEEAHAQEGGNKIAATREAISNTLRRFRPNQQ